MRDTSVMDFDIHSALVTYVTENIAHLPQVSADTKDGRHAVEQLFGTTSESQTTALELFKLGKYYAVDKLGIYANILASCVTVENWFDTIVALLNDLTNSQRLFLTDNNATTSEIHIPIHPTEYVSQCVIAGLIYRLIKQSDLVTKKYITVKAHTRFASETTAIVNNESLLSIKIFAKDLQQPLTNANPRVFRVFQRQLEIYEKGRNSSADIEYKVLREVMRTKEWANLSQSSVAGALAMSERSLTRKLQHEGLKFRDIVVAARNSEALSMLFKGMPINQISDTLGFSDRATFERSFKKWQGLSPAKIQAQYVLLATDKDVNSIVNANELPHLPVTITKLLSLLKQEETDIDDVIDLLETDPVLVAKILRIANSSLYANIKADNLKQAVVAIFGFDKLYALTLSIMSTAVFKTELNDFDYKAFWHHALLSVWVVEHLSDDNVSKEQAETYYLSALLHSIGELVIQFCLPNKVAQFTADFSESITWREHNKYQRLKLGTSTTAVSAFVCHLWHIPKPVCEVLDNLTPQGESGSQLLVDALDIVDYLLMPTQQTQSRCKEILSRCKSRNSDAKSFLNSAKLMCEDLKSTAETMI